MKEVVKTVIDGKLVAIVNAERHISELGNRICLSNTLIDYCIIINGERWSFRKSKDDDFHLGEYVKENFGGGGHDKVAGAIINTYDVNLKKMVKSIAIDLQMKKK